MLSGKCRHEDNRLNPTPLQVAGAIGLKIALTGGSKRVSTRKLPHPRNELAETSNEKSHPHNYVWVVDISYSGIDKRQQ